MAAYHFLSKAAYGEALRKLRKSGDPSTLFSENPRYKSLLIHYSNVKNKAEFHNFVDDIYFVVSGRAKITVGGNLVEPEKLNENDVLGARIKGGETLKISEGDILLIPKKTPHMLDVRGGSISYIIIKITR